jgi:preprotein translocase subunit SecA
MSVSFTGLRARIDALRGANAIETDLTPYREVLRLINDLGGRIGGLSSTELRNRAFEIGDRVRDGEDPELVLPVYFALAREAADRTLGMRPFDVQVLAAIALHKSKLVEMKTGEGKTLTAVLPAALNALGGKGVHVLTFNDYLAKRDADWMRPVFDFLGLSVGYVQEQMNPGRRREAYGCDITYATAMETGFDLLRTHLCRDVSHVPLRPFHFALVDEADSILIDEGRTPLVIAGERDVSDVSPYRTAEIVGTLRPGTDWETDENRRNVHLTESGLFAVEAALGGINLHEEENYILLTEVNQALHARVLLHRDVDSIVSDGKIDLVDEFTGRVVENRRWPDGLQAALEAKEGLEIRPGGRILGSMTMQHFLLHYPKLSGMTATATPAADEFASFYALKVVPIPSNRPCIRIDEADEIYTHRDAKDQAILAEIQYQYRAGRPVLVGTRSVEESERLSGLLVDSGLSCRVLNAKNDAAEAEIIAEAGKRGAITISTNMAGRGTDIKLGGSDESERELVVDAGGLHVIGTNRHESIRIDEQLRGRAGRQGDPGSSKFIVALDDDLMLRFGIDTLIPGSIRPKRKNEPIENPVVRKEVNRLQRIVEGQNYDIRKTLLKYSSFVEEQRKGVQDWRMHLLAGLTEPDLCAVRSPAKYRDLESQRGKGIVQDAERLITLHHIDEAWADHLSHIAKVREGIHLVSLGGMKPLDEFQKQIGKAFKDLVTDIDDRVLSSFERLRIENGGLSIERAVLQGPSSTWTYLVSDQAAGELQQMLFGEGSFATAAGAALMTWPLLLLWGLRERWRR